MSQVVSATGEAVSTKRKKRHKRVEYGRYGLYFLAPFFIVYFLFQFYPLVTTFYESVFRVEIEQSGGAFSVSGDETTKSFVGLENFKDALVKTTTDASGNEVTELFGTKTMKTIGNTVIMWVCNFIPQILLSLLLAAWFTDTRVKLKGQGAYKVIMYMPNIITAASIGVIFYAMFSSDGVLTGVLRDWGLMGEKETPLNDATATRMLIAFMQFWMWYGNTMIILIAGILGISPSLFEAARVDGASGGQIFFKITMPLLKPILLFTLVTSAIGGLQMYDIPALFNPDGMMGGRPDDASTTIGMYIMQLLKTNAETNSGSAAAACIILFMITLAISILFFVFLGDREKKVKKVEKGA